MNWKRLVFNRRSWTGPLCSLGVLYLCLAIVACSFSNKLIFYPPPPGYDERNPNLVQLGGAGEKVACLYYPPPSPDDRSAPVLLWSHGNAEDIGRLQPLLENANAEGLGVLAYDYPGYGLSDGSPSEKGCYRAIGLAYEYLVEEQKIQPQRIVVLGQSVGTGPACWLAENRDVGGLVLISPFLSAFRTVTRIPLFPGDKFKNYKRLEKIDCPLLVLHGSRDEVIPFSQGQQLYERYDGPKRFIDFPGVGHNDIWPLRQEEIMQAIIDLANGTNPPAGS